MQSSLNTTFSEQQVISKAVSAFPPQSCPLFNSCVICSFTELVQACATSEFVKIEDLHLGTTFLKVLDNFQRSFGT